MTREAQWKAHYEATVRQRDRWIEHCDKLEDALRQITSLDLRGWKLGDAQEIARDALASSEERS